MILVLPLNVRYGWAPLIVLIIQGKYQVYTFSGGHRALVLILVINPLPCDGDKEILDGFSSILFIKKGFMFILVTTIKSLNFLVRREEEDIQIKNFMYMIGILDYAYGKGLGNIILNIPDMIIINNVVFLPHGITGVKPHLIKKLKRSTPETTLPYVFQIFHLAKEHKY